MKLSTLLSPWVTSILSDVEVTGLSQDSRSLQPGDIFFAYPGPIYDGRQYIESAIAHGAVAIVYDPEDYSELNLKRIPAIPIPYLMTILGGIASRFYSDPSRKLNIIGVTGTNGKTTIAYQLAKAHSLLGTQASYIGTLGQGDINALQPLTNTTPGALHLQKLLHKYQHAGIAQVCMEVSSHALSQDRVAHICFNQAIYTNLTPDHLDYHQTMQAYAESKAKLFQNESLEWNIINQDDAYSHLMLANAAPAAQCLTYGIETDASLKAYDLKLHAKGTEFKVASPWGTHTLTLNSPGLFNVYNGLAVVGSLLASGYAPTAVEEIMPCLRSSPGRMEVVFNTPMVIVDYAHTPDALEKVLSTLVNLKTKSAIKNSKIWVVFGCGGDRWQSKRALMGRIASDYADQVVITSDNPRSESPEAIIEEILQGILPHKQPICMLDRKDAIHYALHNARPNDIILIAGKGHESYQDFGTHREFFSDQLVVTEFFTS